MKNNISAYLKSGMILSGFTVAFSSCQKNEIIDFAYPDQTIYMAQAATAVVGPGGTGIYTITPRTEGVDFRFIADIASNKLNIPLGVIRSGVNTGGTVSVNIGANNDTINKLNTALKFVVVADPLITTELLPATAYTLPATVEVADGSTNATFNVALDLNFLKTNAIANPKKRFAFAVGISGASGKTVPSKFATTIILIQPSQVILPAANFTTYVYPVTKTLNVVNTSQNGVSYSWNFGDGTAISTAVTPDHVYTASGTYTVTLTTTGIAGSGPANVKTATVVIP